MPHTSLPLAIFRSHITFHVPFAYLQPHINSNIKQENQEPKGQKRITRVIMQLIINVSTHTRLLIIMRYY